MQILLQVAVWFQNLNFDEGFDKFDNDKLTTLKPCIKTLYGMVWYSNVLFDIIEYAMPENRF